MAINRSNMTAEQQAQIARYGFVVSDAGKTSPAMTIKNPPIANPSNPTGAAPTERPALAGFGGVQNDPRYPSTGIIANAAAPAPAPAPASGFVTGGGPTTGRVPAPAPAPTGGFVTGGGQTTARPPAAPSPASTAPNMQADWDAYWSGTQPGDTRSFAGGTLERTQTGSAKFTDASGKVYHYVSGTPMADVARSNPGIARLWEETYGYRVPGNQTGEGSAGIVGNQVNGGQFKPWEVTAPQTVQSQAANIIAADSPLMQQARGRAMQQMNERGLINSSLGVQAAQDAVMERALQIAQPDAATNAQAAQFNANQGNAWNLAQQEMEYKRWSLMQNFENQKQLNEIESKYSEQLNSDANFQKQYGMYLDALFQIDMNTALDPETKLAMKKQRGQELDDYVAINKLGINMDFSDYWAAKQAPAPGAAPTAPAQNITSGGDNAGG